MSDFDYREKEILRNLEKQRKIPSIGTFSVTEEMIDVYCKIYNKRYGENKIADFKTILSEDRYRRRLAFMTLMKVNKNREVLDKGDKTKLKSGFVYIIENSAFSGYYKVGFTRDMEARLKTYQTYDPLKGYKIVKYNYFPDARQKENEIFNKFSDCVINGEWLKINNVEMLKNELDGISNLEKIKNTNDKINLEKFGRTVVYTKKPKRKIRDKYNSNVCATKLESCDRL